MRQVAEVTEQCHSAKIVLWGFGLNNIYLKPFVLQYKKHYIKALCQWGFITLNA
jgi:hypothetical protein